MNSIKKSKKIFAVIFLTLFSFGLVEFVYAQTLPSDCWTQEQCLGQAGSETQKYFFKLGDAQFQKDCKAGADGQYGKCYIKPDEVNLSVPIPDIQGGGSLQKVSQFPEYLKIIYTYFIYVIGIIAVAYIGLGGFEWMMAAGSAEKIGKAKDTIQGAFIGLLLAVGSYVLLGTINSRLVNFDYVRVERIKPHFLMNYCVDTESVQKWIKVGDESKVKVNKEDTWCNFTYYSEINSGNTCQGLKCGDGTYCLAKLNTTGSANAGFECVDLSKIDDRCNEMKKSNKEQCVLFDNYVQTLQKALPNTEISDKTCRFRVDKDFIVGLDWLVSDECFFTNLETVDNLENIRPQSPLDYKRINCKDNAICLKNGEPRTIVYSVWNSESIINKVEVTCTDDSRAGRGTDSICIISNNSVCAESQPDPVFFPKMIDPRLGCTNPLECFDYMPNYFMEVDCSQYPTHNGENCNSKCWIHAMNYYSR